MVGAAVLLAFAACTPDTPLVGAGGECFAASDCEPGLVCVPQRGGARQCSSDLSMVAGRQPPEGGRPVEAGDGEAGDGPMPSEGGEPDSNMPDASKPDTSVADAAEAG
jgi:hypothetical protein